MYEDTFKDKVVAITGAASGIGLATAHLLAARGASLSLADLTEAGLEKARAEIQARCPDARILVTALDVRSAKSVASWIAATAETFGGRLNGAANLAGIAPKTISGEAGKVENQDEEEWELVMGVNATGVMHCMREQLRAMKGKGGGSVVNASSIAGVTGRAMNGSYASSKHAVIGLTRSAAKEVGLDGIRVNAICPGRINTPMMKAAEQAAVEAGNGAANELESKNDVAMGRNGEPEEVARLIAFLLSDESTYVSGAAIGIDGGWAC